MNWGAMCSVILDWVDSENIHNMTGSLVNEHC